MISKVPATPEEPVTRAIPAVGRARTAVAEAIPKAVLAGAHWEAQEAPSRAARAVSSQEALSRAARAVSPQEAQEARQGDETWAPSRIVLAKRGSTERFVSRGRSANRESLSRTTGRADSIGSARPALRPATHPQRTPDLASIMVVTSPRSRSPLVLRRNPPPAPRAPAIFPSARATRT